MQQRDVDASKAASDEDTSEGVLKIHETELGNPGVQQQPKYGWNKTFSECTKKCAGGKATRRRLE